MVFLPYDNQRYFTRKIHRLLPGQSSRLSIDACGPHAVTWVRLCLPRSVFLSNLDPRTLCSVRIFVSRPFARPLYWVRIRKKVTVRAKRGPGGSCVAHTITLIPGDGIGPDVTSSVQEVIETLGVDIEWEIAEAGETVMEDEGTPLPEDACRSRIPLGERGVAERVGPLCERPSRLEYAGYRHALRGHRHHHISREHRGCLRRHRAHGRPARCGIYQDHHP